MSEKVLTMGQKVAFSGEYYIGLDIGTDSIGWAVTDNRYNLIKVRGRELWGSYLFDEAQTAQERRLYRTSRRRTARVRERLNLLQSLFAKEIAKIDRTFFIRLNDSKLLPEDKDARIATKYVLFGDNGYGDGDYFKEYPTVFHLRNALMQAPAQDIRLLYIACHHIIKNRGHFLFEGQNFDIADINKVREAFAEINEAFASEEESGSTFELDKLNEVIAVLKDTSKTKTDKQKELCALLCAKNDVRLKEAIKAFAGGKFDISKLYGIESEIKTSFDTGDFEGTEMPKIEGEVGIDNMTLVLKLKTIYDFGKLSGILGEDKYISAARVRSYETHKADLGLLKAFIRENCPEKYIITFRHDKAGKLNNYAAYIGMDKQKSYSKATREDFYDFLRKNIFTLETLQEFADRRIAAGDDSEYTRTVAQRFANGMFLPKQITSDNGVIPYQLHLAELRKILQVSARAYPFLNSKSDGYTVAEKIIMLMEYRIPYYVGPLGGGQYAWAERRPGMENVKVTPWNFDEVIDRDASEEKFIAAMTSKCTYIPTEDVLPAGSLLYGEAVFLNELNNLRVNGAKNDGVRQIVWDYAKTHKKITKKGVADALRAEGIVLENGLSDITGIEERGFTTSLSSYITLKDIVGEYVDTERDACEEVIKWLTLISDKKRVHRRIKQAYGKIFTNEQINRLTGLTFNGWGRLSAKLLCGVRSEKSVGASGQNRTVIQTLREEYVNLTEVLTAKDWGFVDAIDAYNAEHGFDPKITARSVEELYCSPSVKRAIRRTLALVDELIKIMGRPPKKICVEVARGSKESEKGKRKISRKERMTALYRTILSDIRDWNIDICMPEDVEDKKFASDKVYLYYQQMGKCMYTGMPISFEQLFNTNVYDIDHIFPQSKINDDSLDNRVLVYKPANAGKSDIYPIDEKIRNRMAEFWKMLYDKGLISEKKYRRLTRNSGITAEEQADFENRQLVATRQSTKSVCDILKRRYPAPDTEIVYSKALKAAEFKDMFGLIKVRELNDLHHAKDAYINIIVGNTLNTQFGHDARIYYSNISKGGKSDDKIFERGVDGAWDIGWIEDIAGVYNSNRCRIVRFVSEGSGALFNATIKTKGANDKLIPLKESGPVSDTSKYGGYDNATTAYFMLVKSKGKCGDVRLSLEAISILTDKVIQRDGMGCAVKYLTENCELTDPEILIDKIRLNSLLRIDGSYCYLRGKSGMRVKLCNANELRLDSCINDHKNYKSGDRVLFDSPSVEYLKKVVEFNKKYVAYKRYGKVLVPDEEHDGISCGGNIAIYDELVNKLSSGIYKGLPMSAQADVLADDKQRSMFANMDLSIQCSVIVKILCFLSCNPVNLDLSDFNNGPKNAGVNVINKFIENRDVRLITQSPTGHYRHEIKFSDFIGTK